MDDIITILSIVLSVASTTLSITAIVISWVMYKNSTKMQVDAQTILAQVSQKVDVVVDKTSHQIDRAWDYFTGSTPSAPIERDDEFAKLGEEIKVKAIEEAKKQATDLMKKAGVDKEILDSLVSKVEKLVGKSAEKTGELFKRESLFDTLSELEIEFRVFVSRKIGIFPDENIDVLFDNVKKSGFRAVGFIEDMKALMEVKKSLLKGDPIGILEGENLIRKARALISYMHRRQGF